MRKFLRHNFILSTAGSYKIEIKASTNRKMFFLLKPGGAGMQHKRSKLESLFVNSNEIISV